MFGDRADAARQMVARLGEHAAARNTVVTGIPAGGVLVGAELAMGLRLPFGCLGLYKVPFATRPDAVLGVIDEDGTATFETKTELTRYELARVGESIMERLRSDLARCHAGHAEPGFEGRTVIVTDDLVHSVLPLRGAAGLLRKRGAARLVLATPVLALAVRDEAMALFDDVFALHSARSVRDRSEFYAQADEPTLDELMTSVRAVYEANESPS